MNDIASPCALLSESEPEIPRAWKLTIARVSRMQARNALNILEADGPQLGNISALGLMHEAILASSWRRPTPYLAAAVQHALSMRYVVVKRTLDILLSSILLVVFFPIGLAVALAVALTSPGPVFFR